MLLRAPRLRAPQAWLRNRAVVLGVVLATMLEMAMRQSLAMSDGSYAIFVTRPISATLLAVGAVLLTLALRPIVTKTLDWRARLALVEKGESS